LLTSYYQKKKKKNWFDLKYVQIIKSKHLNEENEQGMLQFNLTTYIDMKRHVLVDCCRSDGDDRSIFKGFWNIWKNRPIISNGYSSDLAKIDQKYCCFVVHGIFGSNICITWFQCCQGPYYGCCMVNGIVGLSAFDQVGFLVNHQVGLNEFFRCKYIFSFINIKPTRKWKRCMIVNLFWARL